jgi:Skp family chaperone for outer membrane proteins
LKHHLAGTRFNVEPCSKVPDDVRAMFLKLLHCQEEESDAKKRKLEKIASGSQEQNAPAENDQGQDGDQLANTRKSQTTVNQFYKKNKRERRFAFRFAVSSIPPQCHQES